MTRVLMVSMVAGCRANRRGTVPVSGAARLGAVNVLLTEVIATYIPDYPHSWFMARESVISSTVSIGRRRGLLAAINTKAISPVNAPSAKMIV